MKKQEFSRHSSIDSVGEDLSFEDSDDDLSNSHCKINTEYLDYKSLIEKRDTYYKRKKNITSKKNGEEDNKMTSKWANVYCNFFNNNLNHNIITLNEFDLRCNFSILCEEAEKKAKEYNSNLKKKTEVLAIHPKAGLKSFMDNFYRKTRQNIFKKIFKKRRGAKRYFKKQNLKNINLTIFNKAEGKDEKLESSKPTSANGNASAKPNPSSNGNPNNKPNQNNFLNIILREIEKNKTTTKLQKNSPENKRIDKEFSKTSDNFKKTTNTQNQDPAYNSQVKRLSNIFSAYDIKDAHVLIKKMALLKSIEIKKKTLPKDAKIKQEIEIDNYNALLGNKHAFIVELDRYVTILKRKKNQIIERNSMNRYEHLIEFREAGTYFENISNNKLTLIDKYGRDVPKVNGFLGKIDNLSRKVIEKLDTNKKIEI